jgi:hypothetical protein
MPNWCDNTLYLKHKDKTMLEKARLAADNGDLFNTFLPLPEEQKDNWYDWHINNWGTKWDLNLIEANYIEPEKELAIYFYSAWSPPIAWYEHMVELGFEVEAMYNEPGMQFCGTYTNENGEDYYEYANGIDYIPTELVEMYELDREEEEYDN